MRKKRGGSKKGRMDALRSEREETYIQDDGEKRVYVEVSEMSRVLKKCEDVVEEDII